MADNLSITANIVDGVALTPTVTQGTAVTANVVTGAKGDTGATGQGVVTGGTAGQVLKKNSGTNYDISWTTLTQDNVGDGTTYKQYSQTEKTKLAGVATGATANDTDANLKARANHTGTQTAATISDFSAAADARITAATGVSVQGYSANTTTLGNTTTGTGSIVRGTSPNITTPTGIVKGDVGLGNVDNTSDASKPVSTLQQTAIDKTRTNTFTITRSGTADYICDGVDDNVQIQAAIDALNTAGGGTLFVRAGTYRITVAVAVPENVTIRGERMARQATGGVTFKTTASTSLTDMFTITGTANPASNADLKHDIVFENITFDGNNTTTNNVKLTNQDTVKFIDCRFIQSTNSLVTVWNSTVAPTAATIPGGIYAVRCNFSPATGGIGVDLQYQTQCWFISCWHTPPSGTPAAHFRIKACNKIDIQGSEFNTATAALKFEDVNLGGAMDYSNYDINVNAKTFANGGTVISSTMSHASSGNIKIRGTMSNGTTIGDKLIGSGNLVEVNDNFTPFSVLSQAAADKVLILKGFTSQSGRYLEVQNSAATAVAYINSGGNWYVNNGSTSAVAYGFASEINTGMYRIGAGNLGWSLAGTLHLDLSTTALDVKSKKITNVTDPTAAQDAATKAYVDARVSSIAADTAAINTVETAIASITIPTATSGSTYRITLMGTTTATAANASTFRLRAGTAGTTADAQVASAAFTSATSGTNNNFTLTMLYTLRSTGATGSGVGKAFLTNNGTTGLSTVAATTIALTPSAAFNTTTATKLTATYASAAATTTTTFQLATIEIVKP